MRYFAKYLPVEGEITKEGQRYIIPSTGYTYIARSDHPEGVGLPGAKPCQLFLCSRGIQVGDKVWDTHDGILLNINNEEGLRIYNERKCDHWIKVLGPISPNAIWIKEGDDILSKDVHKGVYKMGCRRWMVIDAQDNEREWDEMPDVDINGWMKCYLIEAPCGHYH